MEVTANVVLNNALASVQVVPVAFNGEVLPGNGSLQNDYVVQFFPSVASDVPSYDYVDSQDNRRVLKTGDTMSGTLHMQGGDVVAYGNAGSQIKAVQGAGIIIQDHGSLSVEGSGRVYTNFASSQSNGDLHIQRGNSDRLIVGLYYTQFKRPARYDGTTMATAGDEVNDLIPRGYLDTRINNLDLGNTYVAKAGDVMFGELSWDDNVVDAIKIAPVEGSQAIINYFENPTTQTTLIDLKLKGDSDTNRYRILGGDSAANTMVTYTSSGDIIYSTDVSMNNYKVTDLGDPSETTDAANKGYVDNTISQATDDLADIYVAKTGDTMTGKLTIADGGLRVSNSQDINVEGGDVRVTNSGNVISNTWKSVGDSNMSIKRDNNTKFNIYSTYTLTSQPLRYNGAVDTQNDQDLITKGYVDSNSILNGKGTFYQTRN